MSTFFFEVLIVKYVPVYQLMAERDLRALDMRHTLPNLKNLLLTLSHDNSVKTESAFVHSYCHQILTIVMKCSLAPHLDPPVSPSSTSGIETPSREASPMETEVHTPKVSHNGHHCGPDQGITPIASGSTTPTAVDESKKAKPFLGLVNVPFAEFLRGRYPSSNQTDSDDIDQEEVDEEDRKTIHGTSADIEEG